jgi:tRNA G10  N-methylase Trm11
VGDVDGPLLRPVETGAPYALPPELLTTRRYRGKTNEMFTQFMCNMARASSGLAHRPWDTLRVFDPLCGGGTTLFAALILGASVAGVETNGKTVESTASYLRGFMRERGIACKIKQERLKGLGRRWLFSIGKPEVQSCLLAHGDTVDAVGLIAGFRPHLIIADLPYGIQHTGELSELLNQALPAWASLLPPSGAMVLAWESKRFPRPEMIALVEGVSPVCVLDDSPYNELAHRVDRVIKQRDVLVARPLRTGKD